MEYRSRTPPPLASGGNNPPQGTKSQKREKKHKPPEALQVGNAKNEAVVMSSIMP
jgi:hypothetical protein